LEGSLYYLVEIFARCVLFSLFLLSLFIFFQTLPVVPKGSREKIVQASLCKSARLWRHIKVYHLTQNMRLEQSPESDAFAKWLLDVGAGKNLNNNKQQNIPQNMLLQSDSVDPLINFVYPGVQDGNLPDDYFSNRTILCPKNDAVDNLNLKILTRFPGQATVLHGRDKVEGVDNENDYPVEFLNCINASGLPLAHLTLKAGCPLMLLRNIDPSQGLYNGTRMVLLAIKSKVLQCRILGGKFGGNIVFIPRITIHPSEEMPVPISRHQFPVRLAFAMTINKAQGQSVAIVGLDLRSAVFSHGQLYVALSRCTSKDRIKVLLSEGSETPNIVYSEVLNGIVDN
jgi:PIF1-like helicase